MALVVGIVMAPGMLFAFSDSMPALSIPVNLALFVIGGVIGGLGASFGSGCTSEQGVLGYHVFGAGSWWWFQRL
ncbi:MAG: hypothetical protein AB8B58_19740 [Roseobacter sp.]